MTTKTHPRDERTLSAPWLLFQISEQLQKLKTEPAWQHGDRDSITLMKAPGLSLVLIALRAGDALHEHQAAGPMALQVLSGKVRISFMGDETEVRGGELLTVDPLVPHEVRALEESVLLLTVGQ
jgi:quercetin dioxygenase-like cupin family protein